MLWNIDKNNILCWISILSFITLVTTDNMTLISYNYFLGKVCVVKFKVFNDSEKDPYRRYSRNMKEKSKYIVESW